MPSANTGNGSRDIWVHDIPGDYPGLHGTEERYSLYDRRAVMGNVDLAVIRGDISPDLAEWLRYLRAVGIGARHVLPVDVPPGEFMTLYELIMASPQARQAILGRVRDGCKVEVFRSSAAATSFARDLGLQWERHVASPTPDSSEPWNDKDILRRKLRMLGDRYLLPSHRTCRSVAGVIEAIATYSQLGDYVVKFDTAAASGEGMVFRAQGTGLTLLEITENWKGTAIVEEFVPHYPVSLTYQLSDQGWELAFWSLQFLRDLPIGRLLTIQDFTQAELPEHCGNVVASGRSDIGPVRHEWIEALSERLGRALELVWAQGYRGKFTVDALMGEHGHGLVSEANARVAFSLYCDHVFQPARKRLGSSSLSVCGGNVFVREQVRGWQDSSRTLASKDLLYHGTGRGGAFAYHTDLMPYGQGGVMSIGRTPDEAIDLFRSARDLLCD